MLKLALVIASGVVATSWSQPRTQVLLHELRGAGDFGHHVDGVGDVNKDGCDDFILAPTNGKFDVFPMLVVGDGSFTSIGFQTDGKTVKFKIKHSEPGSPETYANDIAAMKAHPPARAASSWCKLGGPCFLQGGPIMATRIPLVKKYA